MSVDYELLSKQRESLRKAASYMDLIPVSQDHMLGLLHMVDEMLYSKDGTNLNPIDESNTKEGGADVINEVYDDEA